MAYYLRANDTKHGDPQFAAYDMDGSLSISLNTRFAEGFRSTEEAEKARPRYEAALGLSFRVVAE